MSKFFKRVFGFIKQNPSVLYSVFLIIFLPLVLWWNTSFTIMSFEKNIDLTLQEKALTIENIMAEAISDNLSSPQLLQEKIARISEENSEIQNLRVMSWQDDKFKIIASQDITEIGKEISHPSVDLAWHQEQNIAHLVGTKQERFWEVLSPVYAQDGAKAALLGMTLSLKRSDALISRAAQFSYIIVVAAILVTLFLVIQHARLFQYLKLYKELRRVDKMKDEFIRMAVHELQSPLVSIIGYTEELKAGIERLLSDEQKEFLSRVSISAKSLSHLIYDILEVVRFEQGALNFSPQRFLPQKIVEEVVNSLALEAQKKKLLLQYEKTADDWAIRVNPLRFREILQNLIENGIKYTNKGKIVVKDKIDKRKKVYYLFIEDTGIGISGEEQRRLFEKFYRVRNKETAEIMGTGLGLWIVKNFCRRMGGDIAVESMKGVGSRFTVFFRALGPQKSNNFDKKAK